MNFFVTICAISRVKVPQAAPANSDEGTVIAKGRDEWAQPPTPVEQMDT
jgi:hypothetical protein